MAGINVFDSRKVALQDIDPSASFTPVLALYTSESGVKLRGEHAAADDTQADAVLDIVAELAVAQSDADGEFADAMASDDPDARLVLAALCSQVRQLLERSQRGRLFRRLVSDIVNTEYKTFAVPELGIRWQRVTIRMHCNIHDDDFDADNGGLPEPMASLFNALPDDSYAKAKLAALAAHFSPEILPRLQGIKVTTHGPIESGPANLQPSP
ncbi:hypothetical protein [Rhizobium tumorigenes]|uniref:hypothetical protein n=1 Tax=Rhizobium tumorigenes TaxID=2041385 RepID=UPI00241DB961|nr:hypothetical protein [Rhizobium tumorigenes]WFS01596.1 hypothetical protein PR016_02880 [Rhizobium tumorigenes]